MKKLLLLALSAVLAVTLLVGCGGASSAGTESSESQADKSQYDFENFTTITTSGVLPWDLTFTQLPNGYTEYSPEHQGSSVVIHYTTDVYEDGKTYDKWCRVYLPYGYDPDDTETKYNVFYFQHGNGNSPNTMFDLAYNSTTNQPANDWNILNNLFDPDNGDIEPFIIVCPTYYFETKEEDNMTPDSSGPAGDGRYEGIVGNYYKEVVEDLIPAVESQFNVYCTDFSEEGIAATRDHRAFGGYSRGCQCTWYIFHNDFRYFKYYLPMSASIRGEGTSDAFSEEDAYQYLKDAIDANPDLDFFIFAASGNADDATELRTQMAYLVQQTDTFTYGDDPAADNLYYTCSEFIHNQLYMPYYLYNARNIIFK